MIILGIDPGSRITGYGLIRAEGTRLQHLAHGTIRPAADAPSLGARLQTLAERLQQIIAEYRPDLACIEDIYVARNPRSALILGHARGALMLSCIQAGLRVEELSAVQIKNAVSGNGRAPKEQIARMVGMLLGLGGPPQSEDAADALAAAIALSQNLQMLEWEAR